MFDKARTLWKDAQWTAKRVATRKNLSNQEQLMGRPTMWFYGRVAKVLHHASGNGLPHVRRDDETGTITVSDSYRGLLAVVSRWDSLMGDGELANFREMVNGMVPLGLVIQHKIEHGKIKDDWAERNGIGP